MRLQFAQIFRSTYMTSRQRERQAQAFQQAKKVRSEFIERLEKCDSALDLAKIEEDYKATELPKLTAFHSARIKSQEKKITLLLEEKQTQFLVSVEPQPLISSVEEVAQLTVLQKEVISLGTSCVDSPNIVIADVRSYGAGVGSPGPIYSEEPYANNNTNPQNREDYLARVRTQIKLLDSKKQHFYLKYSQYASTGDTAGSDRYLAAYTELSQLLDSVDELTNSYANNKISLASFKKDAKNLLDENNPGVQELRTHRGCKEIIVNLLAAIIGNVLFLAAAACAGTFTLFKPATDTGSKVKGLAAEIANVEECDDESFNLATLCHG